MNLFENLQMMNESENKLVSEFKDYLAQNNAQYIASEIGETKDGMQLVIHDGDWKHEHCYMRNLIHNFFEEKRINIEMDVKEIGESDSDTFSAIYNIIFNSEPTTYTADVIPLKIATEDIKDSYDNDGLLTELRVGIGPHNETRFEIYQDGVLMFHSTDEELAKDAFKKISKNVPKEYKKVDGKYKKFSGNGELASMWESNTSNWKQRFKGMDVYTSDKYPNYQINKAYNGFKQEVWEVIKLGTGKRLFVANSFEQAVDFIENGKTPRKPKALDNLEEKKSYGGAFDIGDTDYFTREDLNEFAEDVMQKIEDATQADPIIANVIECYIDENNNLELTISYMGYEHTHKEKIDMRKIKTPKDLIKAYSHKFAEDFKLCCIADTEHELLIAESSKVEESDHNEILDKDYATGEKLYNGLKEYLDSIDQIAMDGDDCNWEPSEYNAKNLNADGEIYLVSGAYILIYPYINEWAEDYFKVFIVEASDLQPNVKAGIENVFNKYKTDKWKLVFEG